MNTFPEEPKPAPDYAKMATQLYFVAEAASVLGDYGVAEELARYARCMDQDGGFPLTKK